MFVLVAIIMIGVRCEEPSLLTADAGGRDLGLGSASKQASRTACCHKIVSEA